MCVCVLWTTWHINLECTRIDADDDDDDDDVDGDPPDGEIINLAIAVHKGQEHVAVTTESWLAPNQTWPSPKARLSTK